MKTEEEDFYNEIMYEAEKEIEARDKFIEEKNAEVIKSLLETNGFNFVAKFLKDYVESECYGLITICETPTGKKQSDSWGSVKGVYVEQHCEMEDSYWGHIYFPINEKQYLKCHYAC